MKKLLFSLLLLLATPLCPAKPPNFIVIYIDDIGWTQTSVEMIKGNPDSKDHFYQTPNLERMAKNGRVLSSCYSPSGVCAPSRNSLLHGMTPARLLYTVLTADEAVKDYRGKITIPQALKKANPDYRAAHFGKWHNESIKPTAAGYDVTDGPNGNGPGDFQDDRESHLPEDDPKRIFSLTELSKDFMKKQVADEKPFYLQLSHYAMHIWHDSLKETRDKYRNLPKPEKYKKHDYLTREEIPIASFNHDWLLNYAAMIDDTDRALGDLLDTLEELGAADNTYVIFTSDNGGGMRGNDPLKGGKGDMTEGGIRVPSFVTGPGIEGGTYTKVPMVHWDFLQTFYDLAGGTEPLPAELDGGSLKDVWFNGDKGTVKRNTEELIFHFPWHTGEPESTIRIGDYKMNKNLDTLKCELYNVAEDFAEANDLSAEHPEMVKEMDAKRSKYLTDVGAETVTLVRQTLLNKLNEGWLETGTARLAKLKKESAADPANRQKAFQVGVSQNHVNFMNAQLERCERLNKMHRERGTAEKN